MTRLIIIRHCQTKDNKSGKVQGFHNDSNLTEKGLKQLKNLRRRFGNEKIDAIYCSDLGRTKIVAEIIAKDHNLKPILKRELRECDPGEWGKLPKDEMIKKWMKYYETKKNKGIPRENIRSPGAENTWDHQKRLMKVLNKIIRKYPKGNVIIVGHSGTNKVLIGSLKNDDPDNFYKIEQSNACINIVETDGNKSKVITINDTTHLK